MCLDMTITDQERFHQAGMEVRFLATRLTRKENQVGDAVRAAGRMFRVENLGGWTELPSMKSRSWPQIKPFGMAMT